MKKNVASQSIGAQMITAADGTAFTGTVSVLVTIDNGTQTAGGGTAPAHEGNGYHSYTPTQAETNGDHIAFTFTGTGAIPATIQVYTTFPQTGDSYARLGAPAGASVSADVAAVKSDTAAILVDTAEIGVAGAGLTALGDTRIANLDAAVSSRLSTAGYTAPPTAVQNADALLDRDMSTGTDSGSPTVRTVRQALRFLRNKWSISGTTLTVTKEDDSTASWTATVTTNALADPITGNDPA